MEEKKGVSLIVYDDNGSLYFLILQRIKDWQGWEFPKTEINEGESPEDAASRCIQSETGLGKYKIIGKLDKKREFENKGQKFSYDIFIVEASMNSPVQVSKEDHSTYYWGTADRISEKLSWDSEKDIFNKSVEAIKTNK